MAQKQLQIYDKATIDSKLQEIKGGSGDSIATLKQSIQTNTENISNITNSKGQANGIASLDTSGKIPTSQLPSFVDDVVEYNSKTAFPATGESGKIYIAKDTNLSYRWSGTTYVEISPSLALGTTSSTAYKGSDGNENRTRIIALETDMETAQSDIEEIQSTIGSGTGSDTLTGRITALETEVDNNKASADNSISTINTEISSLKTRMTSAESTNTSQTTEINTNKNNIATLEGLAVEIDYNSASGIITLTFEE